MICKKHFHLSRPEPLWLAREGADIPPMDPLPDPHEPCVGCVLDGIDAIGKRYSAAEIEAMVEGGKIDKSFDPMRDGQMWRIRVRLPDGREAMSSSFASQESYEQMSAKGVAFEAYIENELRNGIKSFLERDCGTAH